MKVNVLYNSFNTEVEKAEIEISGDEKLEFSIVEDITTSEKTLSLKAVNDLTQEEIALEMSAAEVKQFTLLMNQFIRNL